MKPDLRSSKPSSSGPARRAWLSPGIPSAAAGLWMALFLPGCSSPVLRSIQDFQAPPATWQRLDGSAASPSDLPVQGSFLNLPIDGAFRDSLALDDFEAHADVALTGGDPRGFAGIFVSAAGIPGFPVTALAVRPGGEYRTYQTATPLDPSGGRGWRPLGRFTSGFLRLGAARAGGSVSFTIDGTEIERVELPALPGDTSSEGPPLRVGIFSKGVYSRWKSFVAAERVLEAPDLAAAVGWGPPSSVEPRLRAAREAARALEEKPTRMGLYALAAHLDAAHRAALATGESARAAQILDAARQLAASTRAPASSVGEGETHHRVFAQLLEGRKGSVKGSDSAAPLEVSGPARERLAALRGKLRPLRLDYALENRASKSLLEAPRVFEVVRESFGGLERASGGELKIRVSIVRSGTENEVTSADRRVPLDPQGKGKRAEMEASRAALERQLADELVDAQARADVVRGAASVLGPRSLAVLHKVEIGGKSLELHLEDGKRVLALEHKVSDLRKELARRESSGTVEYRTIPAKLHSTSVLVELGYEVSLDGNVLFSSGSERAYLGIEQWEHPADEASGTPASRNSKEKVEAAVAEVRRRSLSRLRTVLSRENVIARLDPAERLSFLVRLARATGEEDDRSNVAWVLRSELGLEGATLERVLAGLVGGSGKSGTR